MIEFKADKQNMTTRTSCTGRIILCRATPKSAICVGPKTVK